MSDDIDDLLTDAKAYLEKMREHKHCCGTEIVGRLAEMLAVTDHGYRAICEKNDELQALCGRLTAALNERNTAHLEPPVQ